MKEKLDEIERRIQVIICLLEEADIEQDLETRKTLSQDLDSLRSIRNNLLNNQKKGSI